LNSNLTTGQLTKCDEFLRCSVSFHKPVMYLSLSNRCCLHFFFVFLCICHTLRYS